MALTNEQGGRQLGRFILYYSLACAESVICGAMWYGGMAGSGDYFEAKVSGDDGDAFVPKGIFLFSLSYFFNCCCPLQCISSFIMTICFLFCLHHLPLLLILSMHFTWLSSLATQHLSLPQAPWALLTVFMFAVVAHIIYYAICHPGSPSITSRGLLCCSGNRWDPIDEDDRA